MIGAFYIFVIAVFVAISLYSTTMFLARLVKDKVKHPEWMNREVHCPPWLKTLGRILLEALIFLLKVIAWTIVLLIVALIAMWFVNIARGLMRKFLGISDV